VLFIIDNNDVTKCKLTWGKTAVIKKN